MWNPNPSNIKQPGFSVGVGLGTSRVPAHSVCLTTSFAPLTLTSPHHLSVIPSILLGPESPMHRAQPLQHPLQLALQAAASAPGTPCVLCLCIIYFLLSSGPLSSSEKEFRCCLLWEPSTTSLERVGQLLCPWLSPPISLCCLLHGLAILSLQLIHPSLSYQRGRVLLCLFFHVCSYHLQWYLSTADCKWSSLVKWGKIVHWTQIRIKESLSPFTA